MHILLPSRELLGNRLDQLAQLHGVSLLELGRWEERGIEETDARAQHTDTETLGLESVQKLLKGNILNLKTVPDLVQGNLALWSLVFHLGTGDRFAETKEGQCQVDEPVLVLLQVILAVDDLEQFKHHQSGNQCGSSSNSWDDLASDELGLVSISRLDLVVLCSQVTTSGNEIDVMVGVIILLEVNRDQLESRQRAGRWKTRSQLLNLIVVVEAA
ncbi:hypothetical protein HG530_010077 [Fusarium avenaceum]|nr:hypothetical protein HG530_010077 [Fusarium avenaceum]